MDLAIIKKKLSSYKSTTGKVTRVPDELTIEIILAWEQWTGPASGFYSAIGVSHTKMASIIGRGKKLRREGHIVDSDFKEVHVESDTAPTSGCGIELVWSNNKVIRFGDHKMLINFLNEIDKKAA